MENTNLTKIKNIQFVFQIVFFLHDNTATCILQNDKVYNICDLSFYLNEFENQNVILKGVICEPCSVYKF